MVRDLHAVRAGGHVQHLHRDLLPDARVRVLRSGASSSPTWSRSRSSDCSRRSTWRTPAARGTTPRRWSRSSCTRRAPPLHDADRRRRHGGRSVQGHLVGGAQPDHQVHDAVRPARGRDGGREPGHRASDRSRAVCWSALVLRVPLVLQHAGSATRRRRRAPRRRRPPRRRCPRHCGTATHRSRAPPARPGGGARCASLRDSGRSADHRPRPRIEPHARIVSRDHRVLSQTVPWRGALGVVAAECASLTPEGGRVVEDDRGHWSSCPPSARRPPRSS